MATEEYSVGYDAGYQDGWNAAQDKKPAAWVGLTDEEVAILMMESWGCASIAPRNAPNFARAIEAKLREKNGGQK